MDHVLDSLMNWIEVYLDQLEMDLKENPNYKLKDCFDYKNVKAMIKAYNDIVKVAYLSEYVNEYKLGTVESVYKWKRGL